MLVGTQNSELRIEVRDTGIGIAEEAKQRIFGLDIAGSIVRGMGHAGLGLAIVKGYVDLMGGGIEVEKARWTTGRCTEIAAAGCSGRR